MSHAFVLGGTSGLGLALAREAFNRGITPIVAGRSVDNESVRQSLPAETIFCKVDLSDPNEKNVFEIKELLNTNPSIFFWVSGILENQPLMDMSQVQIDRMIDVHLRGPIRLLQDFHKFKKGPYHLVTIASTSSWKLRDRETLYCALKAAKERLSANFALELAKDRPGSRVTVVNPGGIKTALFDKSGHDTTDFMEPLDVARIIWDEVNAQQKLFDKFDILRQSDGSPKLERTPRVPEIPM